MRFLKEEPSGIDKEVMIPVFKINSEEVRILNALASHALKTIPLFAETQIIRHRIRNIARITGDYLRSRPNPLPDGGYALKDLLKMYKEDIQKKFKKKK